MLARQSQVHLARNERRPLIDESLGVNAMGVSRIGRRCVFDFTQSRSRQVEAIPYRSQRLCQPFELLAGHDVTQLGGRASYVSSASAPRSETAPLTSGSSATLALLLASSSAPAPVDTISPPAPNGDDQNESDVAAVLTS